MSLVTKKVLMEAEEISRVMTRIGHEIVERQRKLDEVVLIGIRTGGVFLAEMLRDIIRDIEGKSLAMGILDITLYRDDLSRIAYQPLLRRTEINFPIDDRLTILVDDVLFTGRTVRAAMDALMDFGRPSRIQLAVLLDRGHRELPIQADYVGRSITSSRTENVAVVFDEHNLPQQVVLQEMTK